MPDDPSQPVRLTRVPSEIQAALLVAALQDRGINAHAEGALTSGFRAEAPGGVDILVRKVDLQKAEAALREIETP